MFGFHFCFTTNEHIHTEMMTSLAECMTNQWVWFQVNGFLPSKKTNRRTSKNMFRGERSCWNCEIAQGSSHIRSKTWIDPGAYLGMMKIDMLARVGLARMGFIHWMALKERILLQDFNDSIFFRSARSNKSFAYIPFQSMESSMSMKNLTFSFVRTLL